MSVCSLSYPTCNALAPYYIVMSPVRLHRVFQHYLTNGVIFGEKKVFEHQVCVLNFCITFVWNISKSRKNWARYDQKCILISIWNTRYSCSILMKHKFKIFRKSLYTKFHAYLFTGSWVVPCRWIRTERWTA